MPSEASEGPPRPSASSHRWCRGGTLQSQKHANMSQREVANRQYKTGGWCSGGGNIRDWSHRRPDRRRWRRTRPVLSLSHGWTSPRASPWTDSSEAASAWRWSRELRLRVGVSSVTVVAGGGGEREEVPATFSHLPAIFRRWYYAWHQARSSTFFFFIFFKK